MLPLATSGTSATPSATTSDADREASLEAVLDRLAKQAQQQAHRIDQQLVSNQFPASFGPDGQVVVKDGWRITQRIEEPLGYQPPEASLGVVVTDGVQTRWMLLMLSRETDGQGRPIDDLGTSAAPTTRARPTAGSRTGWPAWSRSRTVGTWPSRTR